MLGTRIILMKYDVKIYNKQIYFHSLLRRASRVCSEAPLRIEFFQRRTNVRPLGLFEAIFKTEQIY